MDAILSSFCFTDAFDSNPDRQFYFHRLPPICFRTWDRFVPDYTALFLFDSFYVDALAVERIKNDPHLAAHADMLSALNSSGRLKVIDFKERISPYCVTIHDHSVHQADRLEEWKPIFAEVVVVWKKYRDRAVKEWGEFGRPKSDVWNDEVDFIRDMILKGMYIGLSEELIKDIDNMIQGKATEHLMELHVVNLVRSYIEHVISNICLADVLGAVTHDWEDIFPIYKRIFSLDSAGHVASDRPIRSQQQIGALFKLMFPDFAPRNVRSLAKVINDRRIDDLRTLVSQAVDGNIEFDIAFANKTLKSVLETEIKIGKARTVTGWLAKPLAFLPWVGHVADKVVEESVTALYARHTRRENGWFYLISDLAIDQ